MPTHPPEVGETLQGACRPNGSDRRDRTDGGSRRTWRDWPPGSDWTDWRDWCARILWTLRAAGSAWITWTPGSFRTNWPDRPNGNLGQRVDHHNDADHDEQLHPPTPKG